MYVMKSNDDMLCAEDGVDEPDCDELVEDDALTQSFDLSSGVPATIAIPALCVKAIGVNGHQESDETAVSMDECSSVGMTSECFEFDELVDTRKDGRTGHIVAHVIRENLEVHPVNEIPVAFPSNEPFWGQGMSFHEYCKSLAAANEDDGQSVITPEPDSFCEYFLPVGLT